MKYGQIEKFPVAPSNTAWLENPPVFLSKEFNFSLSLTFASCFPFLTLSRGHLMKHQSKHSHHLTPSAVAKSFSSKASAQVKMSILEIWIRELWREPFPFTAHRKNLGRLASKLVRPRFAFISVTLKGKKLLKMILSFLSKQFQKIWKTVVKHTKSPVVYSFQSRTVRVAQSLIYCDRKRSCTWEDNERKKSRSYS